MSAWNVQGLRMGDNPHWQGWVAIAALLSNRAYHEYFYAVDENQILNDRPVYAPETLIWGR